MINQKKKVRLRRMRSQHAKSVRFPERISGTFLSAGKGTSVLYRRNYIRP